MPTVTVDKLTTASPDAPNQVPTTVKALLFGKLHELTHSSVDYYQSDYYHDAQAIQRLEEWAHTPSEDTYWFYYAANDCGTAIGTKRDLVYDYRTAVQLNVTLTRGDDGWWVAIIIDDTP